MRPRVRAATIFLLASVLTSTAYAQIRFPDGSELRSARDLPQPVRSSDAFTSVVSATTTGPLAVPMDPVPQGRQLVLLHIHSSGQTAESSRGASGTLEGFVVRESTGASENLALIHEAYPNATVVIDEDEWISLDILRFSSDPGTNATLGIHGYYRDRPAEPEASAAVSAATSPILEPDTSQFGYLSKLQSQGVMPTRDLSAFRRFLPNTTSLTDGVVAVEAQNHLTIVLGNLELDLPETTPAVGEEFVLLQYGSALYTDEMDQNTFVALDVQGYFRSVE